MITITIDKQIKPLYNKANRGKGVIILSDTSRPLRSSRQRQLVLELVKSNENHPTADEIYSLARQKDPNISKGTVYRNLNLLYDLGEIKKLPMPFGPDHYDFNLTDHCHFICRCCGRVTDAFFHSSSAVDASAASEAGYVVESRQVMLTGLCPHCRGESQ